MANANVVCSMCGDVGFADKIFQCTRCHFRFQHSYCTNYYAEAAEPATSAAAGVCDWCISEERRRGAVHHPKIKFAAMSSSRDSPQTVTPSSSSSALHCAATAVGRGQEIVRGRGKSGAASPKPAGRRYKLLKDVLC